MSYELNRKNYDWAMKRAQQLSEAEREIFIAVDKLESVPAYLKDGAYLMENQPESDVMVSFANDIQAIYDELSKRYQALEKDLKALDTAINKYREVNRDA